MAPTATVSLEVKTCNTCHQSLPLAEFHKHNGTRDRKAPLCRSCQSIRYKEWRSRPGNRERVSANWKRFDNKSRGFAGYLRQSSPCQLCGESDPANLDFHHVDPENKTMDVSDAKYVREVIAEAGKCVLVCKECHKAIHRGDIEWNRLHPLSSDWIDARFTEFAREYVLREDKEAA